MIGQPVVPEGLPGPLAPETRPSAMAGAAAAAVVAVGAVLALLLTVLPAMPLHRVAARPELRAASPTPPTSPAAAAAHRPDTHAAGPAQLPAKPPAQLSSDQAPPPAGADAAVSDTGPAAIATSTSPAAQARRTPATPSPAAPPPGLAWSGRGSAAGRAFSSTTPWLLQYSYDCGTAGGAGLFQVTVTAAGGAPDLAVSVVGAGGSGSGHRYAAGDYTLAVTTQCAWRLWSA